MKITITIETDNRMILDNILESFAYTHEERVAELREVLNEDVSFEMTHEEFMRETATW